MQNSQKNLIKTIITRNTQNYTLAPFQERQFIMIRIKQQFRRQIQLSYSDLQYTRKLLLSNMQNSISKANRNHSRNRTHKIIRHLSSQKVRLIKKQIKLRNQKPSNFLLAFNNIAGTHLMASNKQSLSDTHVLYLEFWRKHKQITRT